MQKSCFGSREFHENNGICKSCKFYIECKKVKMRKIKLK